MSEQEIRYPEGGTKIAIQDGALVVPDNPILAYVEGDGIGPDITRACLRVWDAAVEKAYQGRRRIHWMEIFMGEKAAGKFGGDYFPAVTRGIMQEVVVSIKGPLTTPVGGGFRSLNVALRQDLDLYACVRPVHYFPGVPSPMKAPEKVDVVIFRENTEDVYAGIEYKSGSQEAEKLARFLKEEFGDECFEGSALGIKPMSPFGSKRLVRKAIRYAIDHGRESVTFVHKGNIMKFTEGGFRTWGYDVAREEFGDQTLTEDELFRVYNGVRPEGRIIIKDRIADIMFQLMLLRPEEFDVIATPNLNGDYLSDAVAAEVGGVGIAPGANIADHIAVFEATHGTAPKYANKDKVNPGSLLFSGVMMLEYIGWREAADLITAAFPRVLAKKICTYDFARQMPGAREVGTSGFADAIIQEIRALDQPAAALQEGRQAAALRERQEREARRQANPEEEMLAAGRRPHLVGDIMKRVCTVPRGTTVEDAMHQMRELKIGSVLVEPLPGVGGEWGIMTQRDIVNKILSANRATATVKVEEIATIPLLTVPMDLPLVECSSRMIKANVRRFVVEREGIPLGIVSDTDLFATVEAFGWETE
jgi:isocitrate dehydrogenase